MLKAFGESRHTVSTGFAGNTDDVLDIGSRRELFVDHLLIDRLEGAALKIQEPRPAGVAVSYDQPWETSIAFWTTVIKDGDMYRMYYRGANVGPAPWMMSPKPRPPTATCYAESDDGISWTKPDMGMVELGGSKRNNAILPGRPIYRFSPFLDTKPDVFADERYKAVAAGDHGLIGYASGDGIDWRRLRQEPIVLGALENNFDSQNVAFWSEAEDCYVAYMRHTVGGRRSTSRATSPDFLEWSDQTLMSYSDTGSTTPSQHLYTNQTQPYFRAPHIYVSMPGRIHFGRRLLTVDQARFYETQVDHDLYGGAGDISDGVLLTSRAGTTRYDFTFKESFVRPGPGNQNWTSRCNYPALGVVQTGPAEMSMYVQRQHGQRTAHLERLTLRLDGFASLSAPYAGGQAVTKALTFAGRYLELNYATSAAGNIRVEVQDENGRPIPGYTLEECPYIVGDELSRHVGWDRRAVRDPLPETGAPIEAMSDDSSVAREEGPVLREAPSDLGRLAGRQAGKPVRLRFVIKDADLFSIRFVPGAP